MKKEVISALTGALLGATAGISYALKEQIKEQADLKEISDKNFALMLLFEHWLKIKLEGRQIVDYFYNNGISDIAIYGMGYAGERLYDELKDTDVDIVYAIDQNADKIFTKIKTVSPEGELPQVGAIIVTPVFYYEEIKEMLQRKMRCPIISLEDILYEIE